MYGLIALIIGYFIYLACYFCWKKNQQKIDALEIKNNSSKKLAFGKKITLFLTIKIIFLVLIYFSFFSHKLDSKVREENLSRIIFNR